MIPHQFSYKISSTVYVPSINNKWPLWNISFWCYTQNFTYCINFMSTVNLRFFAICNMERTKCENLKRFKFNQNIEILKKYFKTFAYEDVWEFLTPNFLSLFRDDLRSDIVPVTDEVISFWPWNKPLHLPSLIVQVQCYLEVQYGSHSSTKTPQNFLICPEIKLPSGFLQQFLSWFQSSFYCNHAVIILIWLDEPKIL